MRKYLTPSPNIECRDEAVVAAAESIPVDPADPAWQQVETIYDWVRDNIRYEFDPEIRTCMHALNAGKGDCQEMTSLFIAFCRVHGIPARAVWIPDHEYPEFWLVDEKGEGHWFPCQVAGSRAFGYMPEAKPILQKGDKFRVRGHREEKRYPEPSLKWDPPGQPSIGWVMKPAE